MLTLCREHYDITVKSFIHPVRTYKKYDCGVIITTEHKLVMKSFFGSNGFFAKYEKKILKMVRRRVSGNRADQMRIC